jgi:uncharacterized repeat protein (TIGR03803 family)
MSDKSKGGKSRCTMGTKGLDDILGGGLPRNRVYLVKGDPGVGKTTLALQFLLEGVRLGEPGLYITLSETKEELGMVAESHGWDLEKIHLFELSAVEEKLKGETESTFFHPSEVELNRTTKAFLDEVERVKPARVVFDSLSEMRMLAETPLRYRRQILQLKQFFAGRQCTVLLLDDRSSGAEDLQIESIAHGVLSLERSSPEYGVARRQLQVQKLRGVKFHEGNHDFIIEKGGLVIFPRLVAADHHIDFKRESFSSNIRELDALLGGGLDRGTSNMLMGPPGTGKSTMAILFAMVAAKHHEKVLFFTFVFRVATNGALTSLASFVGTNGEYPYAAVTLGYDGNFYGTTEQGGSYSYGTVFRMTTNGALTSLVSFAGTNGEYPYAALTLGNDGNFYGTTEQGGSSGNGTVFQVTTNGKLSSLVSFADTNGSSPRAAVTLGNDGNFYGTTEQGGHYGYGTVFKMTTNGVLTTLISFAITNGENPYAALELGIDGGFYGTTEIGFSAAGTIFRITTNGAFTSLSLFANTNGEYPVVSLTLGSDGTFYGTTGQGGNSGDGVIYRLDSPPEIAFQLASQVASVGNIAIFTVTPSGTAPFAYQWLLNGIPIIGATNSTLTVSNLVITDGGNYVVTVTNDWGSATSGQANLTIALPPLIDSISNNVDGNLTLYFTSTPDQTNRLWMTTNLLTPSSLWQVMATNIAGADGSSQYTDTNTIGMPSKFYRLSNP